MPPLSTLGAPPKDTDFLQGVSGKVSQLWLAWFFTLMKAGLKNVANTWAGVQTMPAAVFTAPDQIELGSGWLAWNPAVTASGSMTVSGLAIADAQYIRIGPLVHFKLNLSATLGGSANTALTITLPVPVAGPTSGASAQNLTTAAFLVSQMTAANLVVFQTAGAPFTLGTVSLLISGSYRC